MTGFIIKPLSAANAQTAFELTTEVFATSSNLHAALSVDLETYRTALRPSFSAMLAQDLSLAAFDPDGMMLGCLIATDMFDTLSATQPAGPYPEIDVLTQTLTQDYHAHRAFKAGETILVDMAAVSPRAQGAGIYHALRECLQVSARKSGWRCVVGELSSVATQHVVLNKMGHKPVAEIMFKDFEWNGSRPFQAITSPPSIVLAEGKL